MKTSARKGKPVVGIAWYRPQQWQRLREVAVDIDMIEQTHAEWLAVATKTLNDLRREGYGASRFRSTLMRWWIGVVKKASPLR